MKLLFLHFKLWETVIHRMQRRDEMCINKSIDWKVWGEKERNHSKTTKSYYIQEMTDNVK